MALPFGLQAITLRIATIGRVQCAEGTDEGHGLFGDLIARIPFSVVTAGRDAKTLGVVALAVGQKSVEFVIVIGMLPWAVIVIPLSSEKQVARTQFLRRAEDGPLVTIHAAFHLDEVLGQSPVEFQVRRSG